MTTKTLKSTRQEKQQQKTAYRKDKSIKRKILDKTTREQHQQHLEKQQEKSAK